MSMTKEVVLQRHTINSKHGTWTQENWCWPSFFLCFGVGGWSFLPWHLQTTLAHAQVYQRLSCHNLSTSSAWMPSVRITSMASQGGLSDLKGALICPQLESYYGIMRPNSPYWSEVAPNEGLRVTEPLQNPRPPRRKSLATTIYTLTSFLQEDTITIANHNQKLWLTRTLPEKLRKLANRSAAHGSGCRLQVACIRAIPSIIWLGS